MTVLPVICVQANTGKKKEKRESETGKEKETKEKRKDIIFLSSEVSAFYAEIFCLKFKLNIFKQFHVIDHVQCLMSQY